MGRRARIGAYLRSLPDPAGEGRFDAAQSDLDAARHSVNRGGAGTISHRTRDPIGLLGNRRVPTVSTRPIGSIWRSDINSRAFRYIMLCCAQRRRTERSLIPTTSPVSRSPGRQSSGIPQSGERGSSAASHRGIVTARSRSSLLTAHVSLSVSSRTPPPRFPSAGACGIDITCASPVGGREKCSRFPCISWDSFKGFCILPWVCRVSAPACTALGHPFRSP